MLVVLTKSIITFFIVFVTVRLMGKREIGEMQPFELVITLIIAEVACIPMNDPYIPFYAGFVPIVTLAFLQILVSFLSRKSLLVRRLSSGCPIIVIDKNGINYKNLSRLNMNVNDVVEAVRSNGTPDIMNVLYAIIETNGKISIIEKPKDPTAKDEAFLPVCIILNGGFVNENIEMAGVSKSDVMKTLKDNGQSGIKGIVYADIRQDGTVYVSPKDGCDFSGKIKITGSGNW